LLQSRLGYVWNGSNLMLDAAIFILAGVIVGYVIRLAQEMKEESNDTN
jgi:hypothetical protein